MYANTYWDATKKCFTCKWRLRRITGGCNIKTIATGLPYKGEFYNRDDMYGCEEYEELTKKGEKS